MSEERESVSRCGVGHKVKDIYRNVGGKERREQFKLRCFVSLGKKKSRRFNS